MMLWLHGMPVVEWVLRRVRMAKKIDRVIFAIPDTSSDQVLADYLQSIGVAVFRGSENDVLSRMVEAARKEGAKTLIRICADNPLICGSEIDRLIDFYNEGDYDYAYNHIPRENSYPDGLGAEITSMDVFEQIHKNATGSSQREHAFNYLWDHPEQFSIGTCDPLDMYLAHPELKLDLDTIFDYANLLKLNIHPEMSAREVVTTALQSIRSKI
jgi:spore coat polysaccharide biosynthesis protein SpsF